MVKGILFTSVYTAMTVLFMCPSVEDRGGRGRDSVLHRMGHLVHLIIKILLCWGHLLVNALTWPKYLGVFSPFREVHPHTSSPWHQCSIMFFLNPWPSNPTIGYSPWISIIARLAISPSKQSAQLHALLELLHWGGLPFTPALQGCPRKGLQCCFCPLLGDAHMSYRIQQTFFSWKRMLKETLIGKVGTEGLPSYYFITPHDWASIL